MLKQFKTFLSLMLIATLAVACTGKGNDKKETKEELPLVEVQSVYAENVAQTSEYTATVEAFKTNNIMSSTGNRIKRLLVDVGSHVRAGQAVVILDDVSIDQQRITIANLKRELERAKELVKIGGGTQQAVDQLQAQYDAAVRALRNLEENTVLTSPISGVVTVKNFDSGDLPAGQPILVIEQQQPLKVVVNVNESDYPHLSEGMPVEVRFDTYEGESFTGVVHNIHPTISPATRTFEVEVTINNQQNKIRTGMFARVFFNFGQSHSIVVPDRAIIKQVGSGVRYVYVLQNDNTVKFTQVELGRRIGDRYEIKSGLSSGDRVVTAGYSRLSDGAKVQIKGQQQQQQQSQQ
ncbi:MAG: efflux RND transporter periplasmic adaptor subunit [Muribaculaceae bacterium]|nr:efflux RND transporter periplasmic adaptor subunit [Muribaculaceae bacterium]